MQEFLTWGVPVFAAFALYALSYSTLQATPRGRDYWMAAFWFCLGSVVLLARFLYWTFTTSRSVAFRSIVSVLICGVVVTITAESVRSISHKRQSWIAAQLEPEQIQAAVIPKPDFKILEPTAFPHLIELDANVFRTSDKKTSGIFFPVVVGFENTPQPDGFNETDNVWAHVIYRARGFEENELVRADVGCWVNELLPDVAFPFHRAKFLILGGWRREGKKPTKNTFVVFEYSRDLHRPVEVAEKMSTPTHLLVDITLTPNGHHESRREYKFDLRLGKVDPESGMVGYQLIPIETV